MVKRMWHCMKQFLKFIAFFLYLLCSLHRKGCFARGLLNEDNSVTLFSPHNHATNSTVEEVKMFKDELEKAVTSETTSNKEIYDRLGILYPEAAVALPFPAIESSMRRWRRKTRPPYPNNIQEFYATLSNGDWVHLLSYNKGFLKCNFLQARDGTEVVGFYGEQFLTMIRNNITELNIDGTFRCVPSGLNFSRSSQLLTIMSIHFDHALPIFWALMTKRTVAAYEVVLQHFNDIGGNMNIVNIMCDFEKALYRTAQQKFRTASVHGCFFHYCQALLRRAKQLKLFQVLHRNSNAKNIFKKLLALPLVPAEQTLEAFQHIKMAAESSDVFVEFQEFLNYIDRVWIQQTTPQVFSVANLIRRTNNSIESYHRRLNRTFGTHPNIWHFTNELVKKLSITHSDFLTLQTGRRVTRTPKLRYLMNSVNIERAWDNLLHHRITLHEFIENTKYFVSSLTNDFLKCDEDNISEDDDEDPIPSTSTTDHDDVNNGDRDILLDLSGNEAVEIIGDFPFELRQQFTLTTSSVMTSSTNMTANDPEISTTSSAMTSLTNMGANDPEIPTFSDIPTTSSATTSSTNMAVNDPEIPTTSLAMTFSTNTATNDLDDLDYVEHLLFEQRSAEAEGKAVEHLEISRQTVVEDLFQYYNNPSIVFKNIVVQFKGELGSDFGGLAKEMFTEFFIAVQKDYFRGEHLQVPFLPLHLMSSKKQNFEIIGRIMTHFYDLHAILPINISRFVYLQLTNNSLNIPDSEVVDEFMRFVTNNERHLITKALYNFDSLTTEDFSLLEDFLCSYDLYDVPRKEHIYSYILTIANNSLIDKPKPLVEVMKRGISEYHLEKIWNTLDLTKLNSLISKLKPTPEKVVKCLILDEENLTNTQNKVLYYFKQYILSLKKQNDLDKFLIFVTASVCLPSSITVMFTNLKGSNRRPIVHTCSNSIELSVCYDTYQEFSREMNTFIMSEICFEYSQL